MLVRPGKLGIRALMRLAALTLAFSLVVFADIGPIALFRSVESIWPYLGVFALTGLGYDLLTRSWRKSWRFTSLTDMVTMIRASTVIALLLLLTVFVLDRGQALPRSALLLTWVLDMGLFGAFLMLRRYAHENTLSAAIAPFLGKRGTPTVPLMLLGGLESADAFLRELARDPAPRYRVAGLLTASPNDVRHEVRGVRVLGSLEDTPRVLLEFAKDGGERAVLFVDDTIVPADLEGDLLARLRTAGVNLLRMNRLSSIDIPLGGMSLREIDFNELLARPPVHLDHERVRRLITGKRVLVTGAGGSIGSEIARQVASLSCAHLSLIDNSEFSLFSIDREIGTVFSTLSRSARLCDVRDAARILAFMVEESPDIVFHAAALKHVPLMEAHPADSVLTNVIGSANVADAAVAAGVRNFVFISTDKAVDPPNVMGATKRLAERTVCQRRRTGGPVFNVVRFGNVLGSAGSVVPTFLDQIARGGPVTLTHPDIERFFMTIPEAVQLVLHATAKSAFDHVEGVLVLDMGKPVKIIDLAHRLIELNGKTPGVDVEIRVTGLRPGEKMSEALFDVTETARHCDPGVLEVVDSNADVGLSEAELRRLEAVARSGDDDGARDLLFKLLRKLRAAPKGNVRTLRDAS